MTGFGGQQHSGSPLKPRSVIKIKKKKDKLKSIKSPPAETGRQLRLVGLSEKLLGKVDDEVDGAGYGPVHVLVMVPVKLPTGDSRVVVVNGVNIRVTDNMQLNPPASVAFWKAFRADNTEVKADAVIKFLKGTFHLGDLIQGPRIYVRPRYLELWNSGLSKERWLFSGDLVIQGSQEDFVVFLTNLKHFTLWMPSSQHIIGRKRLLWRCRVTPFGTSLSRQVTEHDSCQFGLSKRF
ncbi:Crinkler (CRN) [Phytophthora megakarya]|uniref:Crinkler (CRN) n=1 Tax=Phytophthora megakarya TaxID=4795 RepID=A0A225VJU5_9STRA|nr:Crinkler (CRN) [Phytophthora megakarya]